MSNVWYDFYWTVNTSTVYDCVINWVNNITLQVLSSLIKNSFSVSVCLVLGNRSVYIAIKKLKNLHASMPVYYAVKSECIRLCEYCYNTVSKFYDKVKC